MMAGGMAILVVAAACAGDYPLTLPEGFILVAHRGVVTDTISENSLASIEETVRRGYTHIEVDLRATADGRVVCFHDDNLKRVTGIRASISQSTLAELRVKAPEERLPSFEQFCALCEGRINLMPDVKECAPGLVETYVRGIEEPMVAHGLLENALFIGKSDIVWRLRDRTRMPWRPPSSESGEVLDGALGERYFVFKHGQDLGEEAVREFQAMGLPIVASINLFHYRKMDPRISGSADVKRLIELGVTGFQIDAAYESAVVEALAAQK
ncbi:MAG TPA: glycerophosphodiester phosphodiesterase family protein [Candidatus Hydrogenedentes bacterium]|nr:glycerophosphodiester phosphodiesterase family protein [Candidatus Hydrogenedentota bacterium]HPG67887.1 glycerophosphodiester phosphodiesterase family protein [Candidatus Hydrogenedentota bacterium]